MFSYNHFIDAELKIFLRQYKLTVKDCNKPIHKKEVISHRLNIRRLTSDFHVIENENGYGFKWRNQIPVFTYKELIRALLKIGYLEDARAVCELIAVSPRWKIESLSAAWGGLWGSKAKGVAKEIPKTTSSGESKTTPSGEPKTTSSGEPKVKGMAA